MKKAEKGRFYEGFPEENLPGIPSLPFSAFFCLFRRKRMKKDEKGWDRKGYKKTFLVSLSRSFYKNTYKNKV
jgi:hypothetical protein